MKLDTFKRHRDAQGNVYIGPMERKEYESVKEYLSSLGVGYSAEMVEKKFMLVTNGRQLAKGGINLECAE
jgi:hypothetical protein